jgi:hypothetical protein
LATLPEGPVSPLVCGLRGTTRGMAALDRQTAHLRRAWHVRLLHHHLRLHRRRWLGSWPGGQRRRWRRPAVCLGSGERHCWASEWWWSWRRPTEPPVCLPALAPLWLAHPCPQHLAQLRLEGRRWHRAFVGYLVARLLLVPLLRLVYQRRRNQGQHRHAGLPEHFSKGWLWSRFPLNPAQYARTLAREPPEREG